MRIHRAVAAVLLAALGCAPPPPPPPPPPAPPPLPPRGFLHRVVWTARPDVELRTDSVVRTIGPAFTRLDVLGSGATTLTVACAACAAAGTGRVDRADVVYEPLPPRAAARGTLAEFALAVRHAAARADTAALRPVMAPEFTFSFVGEQGVDEAFAAWASAGLEELAPVPALLDRGLTTRDGTLWAAPPQHFETLGYTGRRLGFRRGPSGAWEWVFLMRGVRER